MNLAEPQQRRLRVEVTAKAAEVAEARAIVKAEVEVAGAVPTQKAGAEVMRREKASLNVGVGAIVKGEAAEAVVQAEGMLNAKVRVPQPLVALEPRMMVM